MRTLGRLGVLAALVAAMGTGARADEKAAEIMKQTRAALGGEAKLQALGSLSLSGTYRRVLGERELSGDITLDFLLPDRFKRTDVMDLPTGMAGPAIVTALNGAEAWRDVVGGGGHMIMIRPGPAGGDPAADRRAIRGEYLRLLLGFLPFAATVPDLEFSYAGKAEAEDGEAHIIDVKGENDFAARLFIDAKTSLPLMISYQGVEPRVRMQTMQGSGPPPSREEMEKRMEEERKKAEAQGRTEPPPSRVEMQLRFEDHRKVEGLTLPHRVSLTVKGNVTEEWELAKVKVNPALEPADFEKKKTE
jgi:hypothetical protein